LIKPVLRASKEVRRNKAYDQTNPETS